MENKRNFINNQGGFTLIEIIATLVILGILAAVAVPKFVDLQTEAREKAVEAALAAGVSNATMTYAKFILSNGFEPAGIYDAAWRKAAANATPVEIPIKLGDFDATYEYAPTTGKVTVTIVKEASSPSLTPAWFEDVDAAKKTKTFPLGPETTP
ncbi:MAG: prepilin-type N-terminal cleavage/methylation domain-containing protein [Desulforegulaceae bacterium]|nr:prepilin-type N-terminal cleavage/methylation domain-containing protein [Desulforegulaceae bacterium]